jgi:hypothetical protein
MFPVPLAGNPLRPLLAVDVHANVVPVTAVLKTTAVVGAPPQTVWLLTAFKISGTG